MVSSFFSLVAIDEERFNLDDLLEARVQIEIPVGRGIPTSCIDKVGDLQRPPTHSGLGGEQPNEMWLLQRKRGPESDSNRPSGSSNRQLSFSGQDWAGVETPA